MHSLVGFCSAKSCRTLTSRALGVRDQHPHISMRLQEPLLLIEPSESFPENHLPDPESLAYYGYCLIFLSWALFVVTVNSVFRCWHWILEPLQSNPSTIDLYHKLYKYCEYWDYICISLWCIYVVSWWWALWSWVGIKLFRQSKGIHT